MPIQMWQKIQPIIDQHRQLIVPVRTDKFGLYLKDADDTSDFYFSCGFQDGNGKYEITRKPVHAGYVIPSTDLVNLDDFETQLITWLKVLELYAATNTIYDEDAPILKSYEDEFTNYFEMAGEDADEVPFSFEKQLLLEQYLDWAETRLERQKVNATEDQKEELDSMIYDVRTLKTNLTQLSQNKTVKGIAKFWAKARKYGLDLIKDLWAEFRKEGIKKLAEKAIKGELPKWEDINALIP